MSREHLLACLMASCERCFDTFQSRGFAPLQGSYLAAWLHSGQVRQLLAWELDAAWHQIGFEAACSSLQCGQLTGWSIADGCKCCMTLSFLLVQHAYRRCILSFRLNMEHVD